MYILSPHLNIQIWLCYIIYKAQDITIELVKILCVTDRDTIQNTLDLL